MHRRDHQVERPPQRKRAPARSRLWLVPGAAVIGAITAAVVVVALSPEPARSVSDVRRELAEIILHKSTLPNASDGGAIGPWWVSATEGDPVRGEFRDFHLTSGSLQVAAKSARLHIEPERARFSFELTDVVLIRVPDGDENESPVLHLEHYTLGPVPLRGRIVYDEPLRALDLAQARDE